MVSSIRHWCEVLRLMRATQRGAMVPTALGSLLFIGPRPLRADEDPAGYDPYLEDIGTLWLLHYLLCSREEGASTWHLTFSQFGLERFDKDTLLTWLARKAEAASCRVSRDTLDRDLTAFFRTYVPSRSKKDLLSEESFDCPLVELGLLSELEGGIFTFTRTRRRSLPVGIFVYALLDYWGTTATGQESLSFDRILYGPGSPGAAFRLSENELAERLEELPRGLGIEYRETAGTRVLYGSPDCSEAALLGLLGAHYKRVYGEAT